MNTEVPHVPSGLAEAVAEFWHSAPEGILVEEWFKKALDYVFTNQPDLVTRTLCALAPCNAKMRPWTCEEQVRLAFHSARDAGYDPLKLDLYQIITDQSCQIQALQAELADARAERR